MAPSLVVPKRPGPAEKACSADHTFAAPSMIAVSSVLKRLSYIGSRGAGRASALLGSVAHEELHLADRPVTVITERAAARADAPG